MELSRIIVKSQGYFGREFAETARKGYPEATITVMKPRILVVNNILIILCYH